MHISDVGGGEDENTQIFNRNSTPTFISLTLKPRHNDAFIKVEKVTDLRDSTP